MVRSITIAIVVAAFVLALTAMAWALTVGSRSTVIAGSTVGEVVVNNEVPLRVRFAAGGLTPAQRADTVARRLQEIGDYSAADVQAGVMNGEAVVLIRGQLVATADSRHAAANNTTPLALATIWRDNFRMAVAPGVPGGVGAGPVDTANKLVPIISVGTGLRVGAALVTGESAEVGRVVAVAQIEGDFQGRARVRALVPVGTEDVSGPINRIPRTSVSAYGDIRL